MTAVEPTTAALELELYEFSMGHTNTLSRAALTHAMCRAVKSGKRYPNDMALARVATWGALLGILGDSVNDAVEAAEAL